MKTYLSDIEAYLKKEHNLASEQLARELGRFERHGDIGAELAFAIRNNAFPENVISVEACGNTYTAKSLVDSKTAVTVYAAYSMLTQLRDCPQAISAAIKNKFVTK